ncbi:hypothetical protein MKK64_05250 [Methylobacterium sp. E-025]|jgi:hypothetical protein|uniref:hypothetical protein n=1 Tax=Methylobacterium sp. E-025 TaxID=2836561 RepID=UPI001FBA838D|nr:hypothetical protein [Methylobacterium sp. E-025]MCJ2110611.1 hypothetical protein [Methylobacterium sp. E-025]
MTSPSFVDGLYRLDAVETRRRLATAMAAARAGTDGDAVRRVEAALLRKSRWAIRHLDAAIAEAERPARTPAEKLAAAARHEDEPPPGC